MKFVTTILTIAIIFSSCEKKITNIKSNDTFKGIEEFKIGARFDSLASSKLFEKESDEKFYLDKYELSKEIGVVEMIFVTTYKGKISSVSFQSGKYTNIASIDSYIDLLIREDFSKDKWYDDNDRKMEFFKTGDNQISFSRTESRNEDLALLLGHYKISYSYYSQKVAEKKLKIQDSIEKVEYYRDVKKK